MYRPQSILGLQKQYQPRMPLLFLINQGLTGYAQDYTAQGPSSILTHRYIHVCLKECTPHAHQLQQRQQSLLASSVLEQARDETKQEPRTKKKSFHMWNNYCTEYVSSSSNLLGLSITVSCFFDTKLLVCGKKIETSKDVAVMWGPRPHVLNVTRRR